MPNLFNKKAKQLESEIDRYLDHVALTGLTFREGVRSYFKNNSSAFEKKYEEISELESESDELRKKIKHQLYTFMLIPESRGDVLGLIETLDDIIDVSEKAVEQLSIENPQVPDFLKENFIELADLSFKAVDEVVKASRAFFREINLVSDFVNKVHYYEHEADNVEEMIKRKAFGCQTIEKFSHKIHIRYFAEKIARVSDVAESVCDRLSVYAIKRKI